MFNSQSIKKAFKNQVQIQTKALSWNEFLNLLAELKANK
jgi:hypothetical protein